jgi:predicted enzyme related to lactoylglutathione lyase
MLTWFEIPATDLARATAFYETVFGITTTPDDIGDGNPKSLLPGSQGSIAFGPDWTPSADGIVVYFSGGNDLQEVLDRVVPAGGSIVEPKQPVDATSGFWARFRDTEGNIIGLLSPQ